MDSLAAWVRQRRPGLATGAAVTLAGLLGSIALGSIVGTRQRPSPDLAVATTAAASASAVNPSSPPTSGSTDPSSSPAPTRGVAEPTPSAAEPTPGTTEPSPPAPTPPPPPPIGATVLVVGGSWRPVAWSHDGAFLLLARGAVYRVVDTDGRSTDVDGTATGWWPGAGHTLSIVRPSGTGRELVLRDTATGREHVIASAARIAAVRWSADGGEWGFVGEAGLRVGTTLGGGWLQERARPAAFAFAPAGGRLAHGAGRASDGSARELVVTGLAANGKRRQFAGTRLDASDILVWSPAGGGLAFSSQRGEGHDLQLLLDDATTPLRLLDAVRPRTIRWSPRGQWLAAARPDGPTDTLVAVRVRQGVVEQRVLGPGITPSWSADGRDIVTVLATGQVVRYSLDARGPEILATDADPACPALWSGTRARIAYCTARGTVAVLTAYGS